MSARHISGDQGNNIHGIYVYAVRCKYTHVLQQGGRRGGAEWEKVGERTKKTLSNLT